MAEAAIKVEGLVKRFGRTRALDGLDLSVHTGEVHGFLGPNGAGKTTTLRVLLGLLRADAGTARLLGGDPWRDPVGLHRRLAYVPGAVLHMGRTLEAMTEAMRVIEVRGVSALILANGNAPRRSSPVHRLLLQRITWDPTADVVSNALRLLGSIHWQHETMWVG